VDLYLNFGLACVLVGAFAVGWFSHVLLRPAIHSYRYAQYTRALRRENGQLRADLDAARAANESAMIALQLCHLRLESAQGAAGQLEQASRSMVDTVSALADAYDQGGGTEPLN
jgi:hypothetical protein